MAFLLFLDAISAGFPSPADDHLDRKLDLNEYLIRHPSATFFLRVQGWSMVDAGISDGDLLILDRAIEPFNGCIVAIALDGDVVLRRLISHQGQRMLVADAPGYEPIIPNETTEVKVWGVVTHVIRRLLA